MFSTSIKVNELRWFEKKISTTKNPFWFWLVSLFQRLVFIFKVNLPSSCLGSYVETVLAFIQKFSIALILNLILEMNEFKFFLFKEHTSLSSVLHCSSMNQISFENCFRFKLKLSLVIFMNYMRHALDTRRTSYDILRKVVRKIIWQTFLFRQFNCSSLTILNASTRLRNPKKKWNCNKTKVTNVNNAFTFYLFFSSYIPPLYFF